MTEEMDWSQWDDMLTPDMMNEIDDYDAGKGKEKKDFPEIPVGKYWTVPEKFEVKLSNYGNPMMTVWFRIVEGPFKGSILFANLMMHTSFTIHKTKKFVKSLDPSSPPVFTSFTQWSIYMKGVQEELSGKAQYHIEYSTSENKKNPDKPYKEYTVLEGPYDVPKDYKAPTTEWTQQ